MKVKIEEIKKESEFVPFKVTFFIETKEEHTRFHDKIAIELPGKSCEFIGNVYERGYKGKGDYEGEI